MNITLHQGSILDSEADFIVNPANSHLRHGGGLAFVIEQAATKLFTAGDLPSAPIRDLKIGRDAQDAIDEWNEAHDAAPLIPTGGAHLTPPGRLPHVGVIHAVGPIWGGGSYFEASLLMLAHRNALKIAEDHGGSVAIPAISCGIFGYPVKLASLTAVLSCSQSRVPVEFWLFEDAHMEAFTKALATVTRMVSA